MSQTKVTKPLLLKNGKTAGKSTITVGKITLYSPLDGAFNALSWISMVTSRPGLALTEGTGHKVALWVVGGNPATYIPLQIVAEEVSGTNDYVQLTFRAHKLDNKVGTPRVLAPIFLVRERRPPLKTNQSCSLLSFSCLPLQTSPGSHVLSSVSPGSVQQV